jgi:hypothetical protein
VVITLPNDFRAEAIRCTNPISASASGSSFGRFFRELCGPVKRKAEMGLSTSFNKSSSERLLEGLSIVVISSGLLS